MAMVVECETCRSRFRLNESLLKDSEAIRFRCRKCGGPIMVRNPYAPPSSPVLAISAKIASPMAADISSVVRPEIEQAIPPADASAHRISGEPPVPCERGILETPSIWNTEEVATVFPDALDPSFSPPTPRRNICRRRIFVLPSSKPVAILLVAAIGTAIGCLVLYFLILGFTLTPKWLDRLFDSPRVIDHSSPSSSGSKASAGSRASSPGMSRPKDIK